MSRFSFGMIVFNGDFFLREALDGVYDFAHEIIIIEGADTNSMPFANPDGSSTDDTLRIIREYPDPRKKIRLIQGQWRDKDEQSNAYMSYVTGDFIWLLDSDELYQPDEMDLIARRLTDDPSLMSVSFTSRTFFGNLHRLAAGRHWQMPVWRIHRMFPGATYKTHRPPTIIHPCGQDMNTMPRLDAADLAAEGIYMYHYSYVLDRQVQEKMRYHQRWRPTIYPREKDVNYFHYDYLDKIWEPWKTNPTAIEARYGISPNMYKDAQGKPILDHTEPFVGSHPPAMRGHKLYIDTYGRAANGLGNDDKRSNLDHARQDSASLILHSVA